MEAEDKSPGPVWCVVANIVCERDYGPGGLETRRGTKHFPAGAKVYCVQFFWGMGAEDVEVIGRHRGSRRFVKMVIRTEWLANFRVELVYSPTVIRGLTDFAYYGDVKRDGGEAAKETCERIAARMGSEAGTQPFITRPPSGE